MAALLPQLLLELTHHASALAHAESLEDFKEQGRNVCSSCNLTPQQLAGVRGQLQALTASSWQDLTEEGVAMADVTK